MRSQLNSQNSELDPKKRPSEARIDKILKGESTVDINGDKGLHGETLRPSEREDSYVVTPPEQAETISEKDALHRDLAPHR